MRFQNEELEKISKNWKSEYFLNIENIIFVIFTVSQNKSDLKTVRALMVNVLLLC